jgi:hypothetical protein
MSATVITATMLPERSGLLARAVDSVTRQTVKPDHHLIAVDYLRTGGARVYNLLASAVDSEWIALLPDDDVLYPQHLETLLDASPGADVVYSYCDVSGSEPREQYNRPFDPDLLRRSSVVSHVALVRTQLVLDIGGWDAGQGYDWRFWVKALDAGARFVSVPERTWLYRLDTDWAHESRPWA